MAVGAIAGMEACGIDPATIVVCGVDATADACRLVKEGKMDFTVCQNAVNQANAAVYAGTSDTGYQVWVDFEKVDAANVDKYIK